jgi:hypothetical protein
MNKFMELFSDWISTGVVISSNRRLSNYTKGIARMSI